MLLAEKWIETTPEHSITLFDKGFYSLGLLHKWHQTGNERHWLIPLKKNVQYEVIQALGRSRLPELVKQELWGILLSYNLIRYQMVELSFSLKGNYLPYQLSFKGTLAHVISLLVWLPYSTPGAIPG